mmetsp:Transcript_146354/g.365007  ORF Transcript_146354/g.365007 Transcript_146354/m.365007 type:complete len:249 (+) Transcript_146354:978-1724(+)
MVYLLPRAVLHGGLHCPSAFCASECEWPCRARCLARGLRDGSAWPWIVRDTALGPRRWPPLRAFVDHVDPFVSFQRALASRWAHSPVGDHEHLHDSRRPTELDQRCATRRGLRGFMDSIPVSDRHLPCCIRQRCPPFGQLWRPSCCHLIRKARLGPLRPLGTGRVLRDSACAACHAPPLGAECKRVAEWIALVCLQLRQQRVRLPALLGHHLLRLGPAVELRPMGRWQLPLGSPSQRENPRLCTPKRH